MSEWRPIESAPTMTTVLLFWRSCGVRIGRWSEDALFDERPPGWPCPEYGWRNDGDACIPRNQADCTHWQPLPAPPEDAEQ